MRPYGRVPPSVNHTGLFQGLNRNTKEKTRPLFLPSATRWGGTKGRRVVAEKVSAKHDVWIDAACLHIERGGLTIKVNQGKSRIGTLKVSDTRIWWMPKGKKEDKGMTWEKFNELMTAK